MAKQGNSFPPATELAATLYSTIRVLWWYLLRESRCYSYSWKASQKTGVMQIFISSGFFIDSNTTGKNTVTLKLEESDLCFYLTRSVIKKKQTGISRFKPCAAVHWAKQTEQRIPQGPAGCCCCCLRLLPRWQFMSSVTDWCSGPALASLCVREREGGRERGWNEMWVCVYIYTVW